jgi:hypothetical protein
LKLISDQKASDYLHDLKRSFDSRWNWGQERYIGRIMGRFFSVTYYSGRDFGGRYPVFNKAIGFVKDTEGRTQVFLVPFIGLTDPFSLLSMFFARSLGHSGNPIGRTVRQCPGSFKAKR